MIHRLPFHLSKIFFCSVVLLLSQQVCFGQVEAPENLKKQKWDVDGSNVRSSGLPPVYLPAGKQCQEILKGTGGWYALPRPITDVQFASDRRPCFRMSPTFYKGDSKVIQWSAEQDWPGHFKLLLDTRIAAWRGNDLALPSGEFFSGGKWQKHSLLGKRLNTSVAAIPKIASASEGNWWWVDDTDFFKIEDQALRRIKFKGSNDQPIQGVVNDETGRTVAWSNPEPKRGADGEINSSFQFAKVAFFDQKQWHSIQVPCVGGWLSAAIRKDGSIVLAGRQHHIIVPPLTADNLKQVEAELDPGNKELDESEQKHFALGHLKVGEVWYIRQKSGMAGQIPPFAMALDGQLLYQVTRDTDEKKLRLIRVDENGELTLIDLPKEKAASPEVVRTKFASKPQPLAPGVNDLERSFRPGHTQVAAQKDGSFVVASSNRGLYRLPAGSNKLDLLTETRFQDELLGCDHQDRIYFQRQEAILVFSPPTVRSPTAKVHEYLKLASSVPGRYNTGVKTSAAAIGLDGGIVAVVATADDQAKRGNTFYLQSRAGQTHKFQTSRGWTHSFPGLQNNRDDAQAVWPGRNGWSLVINKNQQATLICPSKRQEIKGQSILDLAINAHEQMLEGAPLESMDQRIHFDTKSVNYRAKVEHIASPWLVIGKSIWISTPECVYRVTKPRTNEAADDQANAAKSSGLNSPSVIVQRVGGAPKASKVSKRSSSRSKRGPEPADSQLLSMVGPIRSGELFLIPSSQEARTPPNQRPTLNSWLVVKTPKKNAASVKLAKGSLRGNSQFPGNSYWFLDSKKVLWTSSIYRVESANDWQARRAVGEVQFEDGSGKVWGYRSEKVFPGYEQVNGGGKKSVRSTYLNHLTPVATVDDQVVCLTPIGLATVKMNSPESLAIVESTEVRWLGRVKCCLGVYAGHIWFVIQHKDGDEWIDVLSSVNLYDLKPDKPKMKLPHPRAKSEFLDYAPN